MFRCGISLPRDYVLNALRGIGSHASLTPVAGKHFAYMTFGGGSGAGQESGAYSVYFTDMVIVGANGEVHPLYTGAGCNGMKTGSAIGLGHLGFVEDHEMQLSPATECNMPGHALQ